MGKEMTILRAIRERSTVIGDIATSQQRAVANAVTYEEDAVDFKAVDQLAIYVAKQAELRNIKVAVLRASLKNTVKIPDGIPIPEAGKDVSVHQAILIRDDLKGYKKLLEAISKADVADPYANMYSIREGKEPKKKIRNFEFDKILTDIKNIQEAIDEIDASIQYIDSTKKISVQ